jgi:hypothetical protein
MYEVYNIEITADWAARILPPLQGMVNKNGGGLC